MTNGNIRVYRDGSVEVNVVLVVCEGSLDQQPTAVLRAEILRVSEARRMAASQEGSPSTGCHDNDFMVKARRGSTHIYSSNWVVKQCTRFNMPIKVVLGDGDARGLVHYVLMYSTKSTRSVSTIACLSWQMPSLKCRPKGKTNVHPSEPEYHFINLQNPVLAV